MIQLHILIDCFLENKIKENKIKREWNIESIALY